MNAGNLLPAVAAVAALALLLGAALGWIASILRSNPGALVERIDALLPQTQCGRCLYPGCRPYAQAIAAGKADIDRCPPGGETTVRALAILRCLPACPVDAIVGASRSMHTVIASQCTGCELCLPPCPVDCIAMVPISAPAVAAVGNARFASETA